METTWDDGQLDLLRLLWEDKVPTKQIGELIGKTKNAVVGKANRIGLPKRKDAQAAHQEQPVIAQHDVDLLPVSAVAETTPKRKETATEIDEDDAALFEQTIADRTAAARGIFALKLNSCRWPMGDPQDQNFDFCRAEKLSGYPYCDLHRRMAYVPLKERGRAA